jgi:hypothetical protein
LGLETGSPLYPHSSSVEVEAIVTALVLAASGHPARALIADPKDDRRCAACALVAKLRAGPEVGRKPCVRVFACLAVLDEGRTLPHPG